MGGRRVTASRPGTVCAWPSVTVTGLACAAAASHSPLTASSYASRTGAAAMHQEICASLDEVRVELRAVIDREEVAVTVRAGADGQTEWRKSINPAK